MIISNNTKKQINWDLLRFRKKIKSRIQLFLKNKRSFPSKLHFGCGKRKVSGWLNIDITNSDYDVDLSSGKLPFDDNMFQVAVSQHFIEHLEWKK
jgi:hypothetical protein